MLDTTDSAGILLLGIIFTINIYIDFFQKINVFFTIYVKETINYVLKNKIKKIICYLVLFSTLISG